MKEQKLLYTSYKTVRSHLTDMFYSYTRLVLKKFSPINYRVPSERKLRDKIHGKLVRMGKLTLYSTICSYCVMNTCMDMIGYPAVVIGKSMQPEFNEFLRRRQQAANSSQSFFTSDLDKVWVSCWKARNFSFDRGDIVVFYSPKEPYDIVIKRVIALEGDSVITSQNEPIKIRVPEGHCWVEGDNWDNSVDSNKYGPIPLALIFGVATHVIWPYRHQRKIGSGIPAHLQPDRVQPRESSPPPEAKSWWHHVKVFFYFFNPAKKEAE